MSLLRNLLGVWMPHFEQRTVTGYLAGLNAEVVLAINGDESALIQIDSGGSTLTATYTIEGSVDGTIYAPLMAYAMPPLCFSGTIPIAGQPVVAETVASTSLRRVLAVATGGLRSVRVRLSAFSAGGANVVINSDAAASISPFVREQAAATLMISATAAVSTGVIAALPAVASLRHYIDFIQVTRSATADLTASAAPVTVTTTNIAGSPAFTFGSDAGGIGLDVIKNMNFGVGGLAANAVNTSTTIICPAYTGVIWRVNVAYRLGL